MMTLEQLEVLVAIEKYGTLSASATALHLSQPSLTRKIMQLEDELGVKLFDHGANRLTLNDVGRCAIKEAKSVLARVHRMEQTIRACASQSQGINYGYSTIMGAKKLENTIAELGLQDHFSGVLYESEQALYDGLNQGDFDFIIIHDVTNLESSLTALSFLEEHLSLRVPLNHPLAKYTSIGIDDLKGQNVLLYRDIGFWFDWCKEYLPQTNFLIMDKREAFEDVAEFGSFPSFVSNLSDYTLSADKVVIPLHDEKASTRYYMVYPKDTHKSALTNLIQHIEKEINV